MIEFRKTELAEDFALGQEFIDLRDNLIPDVGSKLNKQFDEIIEKGLNRKCYHFEKKSDIIDFIKARCKSVHSLQNGKRVFYVDDKPFLEYYMENKIEQTDANTFTAKGGQYRFL